MKTFGYFRVLIFVTLLAAGLSLTTPAFAQSSRRGDMFARQGIDTSGRPFVPSDLRRGSDLFKPVSAFMGPSPDMFPTTPRNNIGATDMFPRKAHIEPVYLLFTYPPQQ